MKRESLLHCGETILLWVGILLLSVAGFSLFRYSLFQRSSTWPDQTARLLLPQLGGHSSALQISGRLDIPRLRVSVLVVDGNEEEGLSVAAVHLAGTSSIGGAGNTVIAAHRDTAFWPLRNIKVGDQLRISVGRRVFKYAAESMQIVGPSDVSVLENSHRPMLTLVTCYPFRYVGNAPKRFVVQAKLIN